MTVVDERVYRFALAAQWSAGVRQNLALSGDRLVVPDRLALVPIPGAGRAEADALPAVDGDGVLRWLRPSRRLVRTPLPGTAGVVEYGRLDGPASPQRLVCGRSILWVLAAGRLDRYAAVTRQRLTPVAPVAGWRATDVTDDGGDGVWLAEVDTAGHWRLRHVDCWGRACRSPIPVLGPGSGEPVVTATGDGRRVVLLDPTGPATAYVVDPATGDITPIALDPVHGTGPTFLTAARGDRLHLLTARAGGAVYQAVCLTGSVEDHQELDLPQALGRPAALAGGPAGLVVAGTRGLADLAPRAGPSGERRSTFITPALVSPPGTPSGWDRAEIEVVLPPGTAMDVAYAATDEAYLVDRATNLVTGPAPADLVDRLDTLLPWRAAVTYRGEGDAGGPERLAALLGAVTETTLWLRVGLRTPPGRTPPALVALRVRYPDLSYLDHLPAIYREDPRAATELRHVLAPYELVFDQLDEELAAIPDGLDPATVGDDRTDHLLSLFGFPPLGDLAADRRRELLAHATEVLDRRGTHGGLQLLLDLVTDRRATVTDTAEDPPAWFLGPGDGPSVGAEPARLGVDTAGRAQRPPPARAGGLVLGATPLGRGCPDPELVLAEHAATVTVTVEVDRDRRRELEPVLDRLLPAFVPAHCRVRLVFTAADAADLSRRLDVDFRLGPDGSRLHSDRHWRLGGKTALGGWALPAPPGRPAVLDRGVLSAPQRLH
jgi:phage tail-like protein